MKHILWLLIAASFLVISTGDVRAETKPLSPARVSAMTGVMSEKMASTVYPVRDGKRLLTIWKRAIPSLGEAGELAFFRKRGFDLPETEFMVVDSTVDNPSVGKVVWIAYSRATTITPKSHDLLDIVWEPGSHRAYLVTARSLSIHLTLKVYPLDLTYSFGAFPLELDPLNFDAWPHPPKPQSQIEIHNIGAVITSGMLGDGANGIARMKVMPFEGHLLLYGLPEFGDTLPLLLLFDLKTKQWSGISLDGIKVLQLKETKSTKI